MNANFTIFEASAGSGKTYNLAKTYINLCLEFYPQQIYKNILCITFTNKAVEEMKSRILLFLNQLSKGVETPFFIETCQKFGNADTVKQRSTEILNNILHNYSHFSICTIDSFFQQIAQSFAIELKLPLNPQLDLSKENILNQIIDKLIAKIGREEIISNFLFDFAFHRINENKNWKIETNLQETGDEIFSEKAIKHLNDLKSLSIADFNEIIEFLNKKNNLAKTQLLKLGKQAFDLIIQQNLTENDFSSGTIFKWFKSIAEDNCKDYFKSGVLKFYNGESTGYTKTCPLAVVQKIEAITPQLKLYCKQIQDIVFEQISLDMIIKHIHSVALLNEMSIIYEKLKNDTHLVHISDANMKLSELIENEPINFIYEKIGNKYKYFFIDEFQDTSTLQWKNLKPLIEETLSSIFLKNQSGKVYLFGDPKQAIYRFRNGNVELMTNLSAIAQKKIKNSNLLNCNTISEIVHLDTNYRSKTEIINFNNLYFQKKNEPNEYIREIYQNHEQNFCENNNGGLISLSLLPKDEKNKESFLDEILTLIQQSLQDNFSLGDIAILVRQKKEGVEIAHFLLENNIETISPEALLLVNSKEVNFVVTLLLYLENENNKIAKLNILMYLAEKHNWNIVEILHEYLNDNVKFENLIRTEYQYFVPQQFRKKDWYQKVETLYFCFNLDKLSNPFLLSFLNLVSDFVNQNQYAQHQFLTFWEEKKKAAAISYPEGINAVSIMTAHKSKGLEFPIVIYPKFKSSVNNNTDKKHWVEIPENLTNKKLKSSIVNFTQNSTHSYWQAEKKKEDKLLQVDNINLEYVIFTRARNRLHIITKIDNDNNIESFFKENKTLEINKIERNNIERFSIGSRMANAHKNMQNTQKILKETLSFPMSAKISISEQQYITEPQSESVLWGVIVHEFLSLIFYPKDIPIALNRLHNNNILNTTEKQQIEQMINNLFSEQYHHLLFGNPNSIIKNEVEILNENGKTIRIDRLILHDNNAYVIDYKTGMAKPEHKLQIKKYAETLSLMNYNVISQTLIYLNENEITFIQ